MSILTFEVTLQSEYHIGSGHRKGSEIDSALLREADGRPALRGTHIGQLLKDAARDLLRTAPLAAHAYAACAESGAGPQPGYCRQWDQAAPACPICHIFGTPRQPRRWAVSSGRLSQASGSGPVEPLPGDWGAKAVTRVRINPNTRRAQDDQLFIEEVGDNRLRFQFDLTWLGAGAAPEDEIAFLAAAAANLRHLGKSRRRGRGECRVRLVSIDGQAPAQDYLQRFCQEWIAKRWQPTPQPVVTPPQLSEQPAAGAPQLRLRVTARLEEPLLLARRSLAGNVFESKDIVSGNVLLGALAARLDWDDAANYPRLVRLFRRGGLRCTPLTLARLSKMQLYPAIPAPLDVQRCKQPPYRRTADQPPERHADRAFSLAPRSQPVECDECRQAAQSDANVTDTAVEGLRQPVIIASGGLEDLSAHRREELHIRVDPNTGRVENGALFEYISLEAGQYLVGELACAQVDDWEFLQKTARFDAANPLELRFGKATRRGHGLVRLVFESLAPEQAAPDLLPPLQERLPDPHAPFRLLLTSDAILLDSWGRAPAGLDVSLLETVLGLPLQAVRSFARTGEVDGFNNHLGLPRWRDRTLAAGSVIGLQVAKQDNGELPDAGAIHEKLAAAELNGIGLRCSEGYGRVTVNHPLYQALEGAAPSLSLCFECPEPLRPTTSFAQNPIQQERSFCDDWADRLSQANWQKVQHEEFLPVGRILRAEYRRPIPELIDRLSQFAGPQDEVALNRWLRPAAKDGKAPAFAARPRKKFWDAEQDKAGAEGMKLIRELLNELDGLASGEQQRSLGVRMLADQIAIAADLAQKEKKS